MNGNDEREFLHDLASPLVTATYIAEAVLESLDERALEDFPELAQLRQLHEALQKMKNKLGDRRNILIQRGIPSARGGA